MFLSWIRRGVYTLLGGGGGLCLGYYLGLGVGKWGGLGGLNLEMRMNG